MLYLQANLVNIFLKKLIANKFMDRWHDTARRQYIFDEMKIKGRRFLIFDFHFLEKFFCFLY